MFLVGKVSLALEGHCQGFDWQGVAAVGGYRVALIGKVLLAWVSLWQGIAGTWGGLRVLVVSPPGNPW